MYACKILLADNNIVDQYLLKELVRQLDRTWRVHVVPSGRQALRYLNHLTRSEYPSLILMDYSIPLRGAAELIDRLMHDVRYRSIPKFVWSAISFPEGVERCLNSGALAFFRKPQRASETKALVRQLITDNC